MPYIDQHLRDVYTGRLSGLLNGMKNDKPSQRESGVLNYIVTKIVLAWIALEKPSYTRFNAAIGVLECAKQELYRRMVVPYEEGKRAENGDVYPEPSMPEVKSLPPHIFYTVCPVCNAALAMVTPVSQVQRCAIHCVNTFGAYPRPDIGVCPFCNPTPPHRMSKVCRHMVGTSSKC